MFLTAAAQNLLCLKLAEGLGVKIPSKWVTWLKVACLPAVVSIMVTPVVLYKIFPPEMKDTPDAPIMAKRRLEQMGKIKRDQWLMLIVMLLTVGLWIAGYVQESYILLCFSLDVFDIPFGCVLFLLYLSQRYPF